jgi:ligand-binding sensor domain-containing protein/two-component sensor histidine kinase
MIKNFLFLLLFLFPLGLLAQRYSFVSYSTAEGLPQSQVTSITQDQDGYMWIGTLGGLAKFNGKTFETFTPDMGLFNNKITFLKMLDKQLWIGHEGGVSIYKDGKFNSFSFPQEMRNAQVSQILKYQDLVILSTNGEGLFQWDGNKLVKMTELPIEGERIRDMAIKGDTYYLGTKTGVFYTKNFKSFKSIPFFRGTSISEICRHEDHLLISTYEDGLFEFKENKIKSHPIPDKNASLGTYVDQSNNLWLRSYSGIQYESKSTIKYINEKTGLPYTEIKTVFQDDEGNMWIGTLGQGLLYFPGFSIVHFGKNSGLNSELVTNVNQDGKKSIWIGTFDKGLYHYNQDHFKLIDSDIGSIWASALDVDQKDWFGGQIGLLCIDKATKQKTRLGVEDGLLSNKVSCLKRVSATKMLVAGSGGIQSYNHGVWKTLHDNSIQNIGTIRSLIYFQSQLFIATDKGFYVLEKNAVKLVQNFYKTTFSMVTDDNNHLWLGTEEGLYRFDGVGKKIKAINYASEPPSRFINFLNIRNNTLFIGTNNGLFLIEVNGKGEISQKEQFGIQEGVVSLESNLNSSHFDLDDHFWFGTASGLVRFTLPKSKTTKPAPRIILKKTLVNYKELPTIKNKSYLGKFAYNKNNLLFEFDAISFSQPDALSFQYWLEGIQDSWAPPTSNSSSSSTGLSPGTYTLHARVIGFDGDTSKDISITFEISPPFYYTWWFITACIILVAYTIFQLFKFRLSIERSNNEIEKATYKAKLMSLEHKSLSASMNRHFIFNSLNSIQYFINTQDKKSANKFLTNFAQLIRKNLDAAEKEGSRIELSKEIERLKLYLELESMRFQEKFSYNVNSHSLDVHNILIPSMLLQPFVENSIIHGVLPRNDSKGRIDISLYTDGDNLFVKVEDNGIGISQSMLKKTESSPGDHKSQGMEITAKRIELIKKLSKQDFEIVGPEDRYDENRLINGTVVLLKMPLTFLDDVE